MTPRLARWRSLTDWPLMVIAIGSLPILLLEIERHELPTADRLLIDVVNLVVLVAFATDYVVELVLQEIGGGSSGASGASLLIEVAQGVALVPALVALGSPGDC